MTKRSATKQSPCVKKNLCGGGFSLVELVVVIVIIGIIAAIAVPRVSRGASGASEASLRGNLHALRTAVGLFAAQHLGKYPSLSNFRQEMTQYTDDAGNFQSNPDATHIYGPYMLRLPILGVGEGPLNGRDNDKAGGAPASGIGWIYNETTGVIRANSGTAEDEMGVLYTDY